MFFWSYFVFITFISRYLISLCRTSSRSWRPTGRSIYQIQHRFLIMVCIYNFSWTFWFGLYVPFLTFWIENIFYHMDHTICGHQITVGHLHWVDIDRIVFLWRKYKMTLDYRPDLQRIHKLCVLLKGLMTFKSMEMKVIMKIIT